MQQQRHRRCFSASFANIYDVFRCKQLQPEAVAMSARSLVPSTVHRHLHTKPIPAAAKKTIDSSSGRPKSSSRVPKDDLHEQQQQQQQRMMEAEAEAEAVAARKTRALAEMQAMVRGLQSGEPERLAAAAGDIRLAARRDGEARTMLAMMGAIPPLVGMLDSSSTPAHHSSALLALLNLAVRNDQNKAAIVAAGAVPRIIRLLLAAADPLLLRESAAAALLSLSALDANKAAIGAAGAADPLVRMIIDRGSSTSLQARKDAMGALYNLSICPANATPMVEAGAVPALLAAVYEPELCGRAVATAGNMAATPAGRRAMAAVPGSALVFVDVIAAASSWGRCCGDGCRQQERAAYVVMVMAEYSPAQRRAMSRGGAASALLELVLVGSSVAQERASRALECLRAAATDDVGDAAGSADSSCRHCCFLLEDDAEDKHQHRQQVEKEMVSEERRAVNRMVQHSLRLNMQRITKRACLPSLVSAHQLAITATPSSRSLPY